MQANESTGDWLFLDKPKPEPKAEARERAAKIVQTIANIKEAPEELAQRQWDIRMLSYFIRKAKRGTLDLNDHDGIMRTYGAIDELAELTERDLRQMRDNPKIWRKYPKGHLVSRKGARYCSGLHPKEIAVLEEAKTECENMIWEIKKSLPLWEKELKKLRAAGPLPDAVAARYALTPSGEPLHKES